MTDLATLGMRIDASQVATGTKELDKLTAAGTRAEKATDGLAGSAVRTSAAMRGVVVSAGQQRAGMQQLSYQIGDVAQQYALGARPMQIFAAQGSQVVQAISLMRGQAGGLIGFLSGPWGAALLGAATIVGALASAHNRASEATDAHKDSAEDLIDSLVELHEKTIQQTNSTYASVKANLADAAAKRQRAIDTRDAAKAELELAKAAFQKNIAQAGRLDGRGDGGTAAAAGSAALAGLNERSIANLDAQIGKLDKAIAKGSSSIRLIQGQLIGARIDESLDAAAGAAGRFSRREAELNKQLDEGTISLTEYATQLRSAKVQQKEDEEAARKSGRAHREKKAAISEAQREYERALKATDSYIESLEDEIAKIGKTEAQIRALGIAKAIDAAATDDQRVKIAALSVVREQSLAVYEAEQKAKERAKADKNLLANVEREMALLGVEGDARARLSLELEVQSLRAQQLAGDINLSAEAIENYYQTSLTLIDGESALQREAENAQALLDKMDLLAFGANAAAEGMEQAFGRVGAAIGGVAAEFANYAADRAHLDAEMANAQKKYGKESLQYQNAANAAKMAEIDHYRNLAGTAKTFFKEGTTGYQLLGAAEKAFAAIQVVNTIKNVAAGASKMFAMLGPFAFPAVAAMVAVMAGFGFRGGGGSQTAPTSADDLQAAAGTGTVLGDVSAKSDSIARSLELVADNTNRDLQFSNEMLKALRSIDDSIAQMAGTVARQISVNGSVFDTSGANLGTTGKKAFLGLFGGGSTTRTLFDLGINLGSATVASIVANGISGSTYQTVEQVKKKNGFLGIGGSTKTTYQTTSGGLPGEVGSAIQQVILAMRDGLVTASGIIGLEGAEAILDSFRVSIGKISFKDMSGEEIEKQLQAIFSSVGDKMAATLLPGLASIQRVGEGLFETFIRVAKEYEAVDYALKSIGKTFGMVGLESVALRSDLVSMFDGLEGFLEATDFFADQFLTDAQRIAPVQAAVTAELERLGYAGIQTREQFAATVLALDLTTQSGREAYAALLNMAPAFDKVIDYFDKINETSRKALEQTVEQFTKFADSLQKFRDGLFLTEAAQGNAYAALRARFNTTAALAATGDASALGGLEGAGKAFLDSSLANASTRQDYLRDVAAVARGVDAGIFAAEETADYAQLQLDALTNATTILQQIADNTAALAAPVQREGGRRALPNETKEPLVDQNLRIIEQNAVIIDLLSRQDRTFSKWDNDGLPEERVVDL